MSTVNCKVCEMLEDDPSWQIILDSPASSRSVANQMQVGKSTVNRHRQHTPYVRNKVALSRVPVIHSVGTPAWPLIQPATQTTINVIKYIPAPVESSEWKTAVILPDPQIGFRKYEDGTLDPFHDERAMSVALKIVQLENPEQVVNLGDFLDLPQQGKYEQEASFANTTQLAIDAGYEFLAKQRNAAPKAKIILVEGNHDRRMQKFVQFNALSAFGLKRAGYPDSWPVMSIPYLLRLDDLGIDYIDAYPAGVHWITHNLRAIHGNKVRSGGSTAASYANSTPHISTVFGHIHRLEIQSRTTFDRLGKIRTMNISPGALCRVDGAVPSVNGAIGIDGRPVDHTEDWQQGVAVIKYKDSGEFFVDLVQIEDGHTVYQGKDIYAD